MHRASNLSSILLFGTSLILIGCDEKVQTIDWYKAHETKRKEMVSKCNSEFKDTLNCNNARKADIAARGDQARKKIRKPIF